MSDIDTKYKEEKENGALSYGKGPKGLNGEGDLQSDPGEGTIENIKDSGKDTESGPIWDELSESEKVERILNTVQRITPDGLNPVEALEKLQSERDHYKEQMLRAAADLDNYKKKSIRERSELLKFRNEDLLRALLPVVDNIDRALNHCEKDREDDPFVEGVCMIADMLKKILDQFGVKPVEAVNKEFDPSFHEAMAKVPTPDSPPNMVLEEMEKGYMYNDRLLRPSRVVVSTKPEEK